jgi:hypothetical protein
MGEDPQVDSVKGPSQCTLGTTVEGTCIVVQDDPCDTLGIPEQLVDVIVSNDVGVIFLSANEPSIDDFVSLISDESIQWFNDTLEVEAFIHRSDTTLALRGSIVIICALEDETQAFGYKANLGGLPPAE